MDKHKSDYWPRVSIIIPSFNSLALIEKSLRSALASEYPNFEVVVVDDCSTDGSFELIHRISRTDSRLKVLRNQRNYGPSATRNAGIKAADGKYIVFFETDMEAEPNWLREMVRVLDDNSSIGAVQSKVLDINRRDLIQAVGVRYVPHIFWVISLGFGEKAELLNSSEEVSIGAVGSVVRRQVLEEVGGFDEKLVHNIDDIDLGWRIWLAGYRIISVPQAVTYHWTSKPSAVREKATPGLRSEFHFNKVPRVFLKNYEIKNLIRYIPWALGILFLRGLANLLRGNLKPLAGFLMACVWNIRVLPDTLRERRRIQAIRKVSDSYLMEKIMVKGSIFSIYKKYFRAFRRRMDQVFA
jgi:GT2 family glycosyltransferase